MRKLTDPKETATRKRIDAILNNLKWDTDEASPSCNVFTERAKTRDQKKALGAFEPDYLLYQSGTDTPVAVIEAKRSGQSLTKALEQAIERYAKPLKINIVFVADGSIVVSHDIRSGKPLRVDEDLVTELLTERQILRHITEGADIYTPDVIRHTKQELIQVFGEANDLLRKEGLREGVERFTEFSNLLFLKLISEIEDDRARDGEKRILEKKYCWETFYDKPAGEMLDYINDTILPRLVDKYNHSGDVFQKKLLIKTPETLERIVKKLSKLTLLDTDSDIKGDAFEYFLKNSISVGNDLGEYFTPRHIVKLMVDLVDPKYGETVYDPACGTGGFLIQAFRHIKVKVSQTKEHMKVLKEDTIWGRELTGTAKIAKMNMIIIGDGHTNIEQIDSLKMPVKGKFDVVLSNFPFSQTTDFSTYYGLETESANPVFLKHIMDALTDTGRAGVIVPEGMLFDESHHNARVRRLLLEGFNIEAIINLNSYVFRPYTGQPTSILIFGKGRKTKRIWFFEVKEDGFEKSTRKHGRRPIAESDFPLLRQSWNEKADSDRSFTVEFDTIVQHGYKLTIDEYRKTHDKAGWVPLGGPDGVCDIIIGGTPSRKVRRYFVGKNPWVKISDISKSEGMYIDDTEEHLSDVGVENSNCKPIPKDTLLLSFKLSIGKVAMAGCDLYTNEAIAALVPKDKRVLPKYLYYILPRLILSGSGARQAAKGQTSSKGRLEKIFLPLPSISVQASIVRDMEKRDAMVKKHREEIRRIQLDGDADIDNHFG